MTRAGILTAIVVGGLSVAVAAAQRGGGEGAAPGQAAGRAGGAPPPARPIEHVRDNLYKVPGTRAGNTTVFVTGGGVVLVDTQIANAGPGILEQVRTVTDKPVTMIINTHSHPDHNGSNDYIKQARPTIEVVTHENTRKWVMANPASKPEMKPDRTFTDRMTLGTGKDRIELFYFGAGHTDGDAFVVFPSVRAMCIGDLMAWNMAPLIDPAAGGSVLALPDTLDKAAKTIRNVDLVIEGHGNVNTWQGMKNYAAFMRTLVDTARQGLRQQWTTERALDELKKNPRLAVFLGTERLKDLEYGDTPEHRALINLNVAYQELRGDPVTSYFGPPVSIGPEKGSGPPPRGGGAGRGAAPAAQPGR